MEPAPEHVITLDKLAEVPQLRQQAPPSPSKAAAAPKKKKKVAKKKAAPAATPAAAEGDAPATGGADSSEL